VLATGLVCPCHVLAGIAALVSGAQPLSTAAQDSLHAVYAPVAVIAGAAVLRLRPQSRRATDDARGTAR
jgi:hypothetical protein